MYDPMIPNLMTNDYGIELANNMIKLMNSKNYEEWIQYFVTVLEKMNAKN